MTEKIKHITAWISKHKLGCSITAAVLVIYIAGVIVFSGTFMPNTRLSGRDISLKPASEVATQISGRFDNYELDISGDDFSLTVPATQIDLRLDADACTQAAIEDTNPWASPVTIWQPHDLEEAQKATYNDDSATQFLQDAISNFNSTATAPTDATIVYNKDRGSFEVKPDAPGTTLDQDAVTDAAKNALNNLDRTLELGADHLQRAKRTTYDAALPVAISTANTLICAKPQIQYNGQTLAAPTEEIIASWITLDDSGTAVMDDATVQAWCDQNVGKYINTVGASRTYTRPDNKQITVKGGTYGWKIDASNLASELMQAIRAGGSKTISVNPSQTADQLPDAGGKDFSDTYIDVDLAEQHARFYQAGELVWEADIVSGNPNQGHATPQGVYTINSNFNKAKPASTLIGKYDPEKQGPEYESKVQYWMPFSGNSVGLHDADWRSSFGKNIYLSNGSHGCVNLPPDKAGELCGLIDRGTVVVVHG